MPPTLLELIAKLSYSAALICSQGIQQPNVNYYNKDDKKELETQQSLESFACDGLNGGAEEIRVPESQSGEHTAAPQKLDVKVNPEPMNRDEAAAVPVPQAPLPLTAALVETNPDNGTTT